MNKASTKDSRPYHHGDLRQSLLQEAAKLLASEGIDSLSLRRLADKVGVSRTALYHHFKDKHALLCAIAAEGFAELESIMAGLGQQSDLSPAQRYGLFARNYLNYATQNPARYGLMFGHTLWRQNLADDSLKGVAYQSFKQHLNAVKAWQAMGILPHDQDSLRLTQVTWGTLHGLAQLVIDGVYADSNHLDEICQCVGELFSRA
ncbi:TetR/AcrR family transcriptional regulator [Simiduia curdlanivorans]|uniref:TetR/AcrR family transcriptional regulator n=1 Tax=Simiduia curdlanivorans TaxID=1492769 RepID=A0ABV8V085_9GAMM|nr:TetR/AcrR family transcriptional regulator [Simiduia curdlanivorans]MDN3639220.1 TetR/AcrR family transcriptional regulator [Simiduia curdlanivorans]